MLQRTQSRSFQSLMAEIAAVPLSTVAAFNEALVSVSRDDLRSSTKETGLERICSAMERELSDRFTCSIDELHSLRDVVWFSKSLDRVDTRVSMLEYTRRIANRNVLLNGYRLVPGIFNGDHPDFQVDPRLDLAGQNTQRFARNSLTWLLRSVPSDLIGLALGRNNPIVHLTKATQHSLEKMGFAETHLHLGASMSFSHLWPIVINTVALSHDFERFGSPHSSFGSGAVFGAWILKAAIARQVLAIFISRRRSWELKTGSTLLEENIDAIADQFQLNGTMIVTLYDIFEQLQRPSLYQQGSSRDAVIRYQNLFRQITSNRIKDVVSLRQVYDSDPISNLYSEDSLVSRSPEKRHLASCFEYLDQMERRSPDVGSRLSYDRLFSVLFWQTQRIRNLFYRHITQPQSVRGLVWFTRYYRRISPAKGGAFPDGIQLLAGAVNNGYRRGLQSIEVRLQPPIEANDVLVNIEEIAAAAEHLHRCSGDDGSQTDSLHTGTVRGGLYKSLNAQRKLGGPPSTFRRRFLPEKVGFEVGLVYHFVKERERSNQDFLSPFGNNRHELPNNTLGSRYRYVNYYHDQIKRSEAVAKILRRFPLSLQWLRAVDVCNDELGLPTWIFRQLYLPILNASKEASLYLADYCGLSVPPIRTTGHVGEDFRHLLTGLRRIDEAIEHLEIREGDRIGHALALGIDADEWADNTGYVAMDKVSRLFDLVWEWSTIDILPANNDFFRTHQIEMELFKLIDELFSGWNMTRPKDGEQNRVDVSYDVHTDRPRVEVGKIEITDLVRLRNDLNDTAALGRVGFLNNDNPNHVAKLLHSRADRILFAFLTDRELSKKGLEVTLVNTFNSAPTLRTLQNALRRKISARGIIVEVNPTSNLVTGGYADLQNHPMWRLNSPAYTDPDIPPVDICVGSDDPLVFNTNLPEEYQRLADALAAAGFSEGSYRPWLDGVREKSLEVRHTLSEVSFQPISSLELSPRHFD